MKLKILLIAILLLPVLAYAQHRVDSLKQVLSTAKTDSAKYMGLGQIAIYYGEDNYETAIRYADQCLAIAQRNDKLADVAEILTGKGYWLMHLKRYTESLQCLEQAKQLAEDPANTNKFWREPVSANNKHFLSALLASIHHNLGHLMGATNNTERQVAEYRLTLKLAKTSGDTSLLGLVNMNLGYVYLRLNKTDSAFILEKNAESIFKQIGYKTYLGDVYSEIAQIYFKRGDKPLALLYDHLALNTDLAQNNMSAVTQDYENLTTYYLTLKQPDSSLFFAKKFVAALKSLGLKNDFATSYENLSKSYLLNHETDSAYKYQGLALVARDSSFVSTLKSLSDFQKLSFKNQVELNRLQREKDLAQSRNRDYWLIAAICVFILLSLIFYRNNRQKQKANYLLNEQKEKIASQRDHLEDALEQLQATQTQLIQSEKMASLGELTAGIAHEIQNPLNFVNNFSEVNTELVDEMLIELERGDLQEVKNIALDLQENEKKVNMHGKRADSIVKGMLEHSRASTGQKEPTDMNKLVDEYLRLAYHGFRAKDKSFNAELITKFDDSLPLVKVIPQDLGRVMLNLFNNAIYAIHQKQKTAAGDYKPAVEVTTIAKDGQVQLSVKDNGVGIPGAIKDKIMQPFFTTKPTGEGTGLGLSLSYDIVVKGHGGTIQVNSVEGEGSEFIIQLPNS